MNGVPILSLVIFSPLIGALVLAFVPRERLALIRWLALATALVSLLCSLIMVAAFNGAAPDAGGFRFVETAPWIPAFGIQYKVGVDGISLLLVVLTTLLTAVSILASFGPIKERVKEYMISFLVLEVGMLGVFLALDTFLFYVFWEVVLVPMYLIIGIWGGPNRIYATLKFVIYTLVGSLLMLVAILGTAFVFASAHGGDFAGAFDYEQLRGFGFSEAVQLAAFVAFFLAFAIKVPMFPFHTWLPDAHVEAPTAGSVILAGVLLKLGGYGFIRFSLPLFPQASQDLAIPIIVLSLIAIVYGAIVALVQPDLKKLIAYSSVSHMGFVTLGIFVFQQQALQGAVLQMVNHGLITGALFLLVGVIYERTHDRTIARMGGLAAVVPVYALVFAFFMLASIGLPGLSGFVGEFMVFLGSFAISPIYAGVAVIVMTIGAAYLLWLYQRMFTGDVSEFLRGLGSHLTDVTPTEILTLAPLAALVLIFGIVPGLLLGVLQVPTDAVLAAFQTAGRGLGLVP
ncbi:MAG: complex I subunit 4 family protein [Candidatus Limnocylindrales bacterium]